MRSDGLAAAAANRTDYTGKYHDVWVEPIMATLAMGIVCRLVLLVLMMQTRRNFGTGLKGFSMHREYLLPERLKAGLSPEHSEGVKAMVRGLHLIGTLEFREYAAAAAAANAAGGKAATAATALGSFSLFTNKRRFFQLSNDLTTLR